MRRHTPFLFSLAILLALAGCSSSPSGPSDGGFRFQDHFTPEELEVVDRSDGRTLLRLHGIEFDGADNAQLTTESQKLLDKFSKVFAALPDAHFSVESHSSTVGAEDYLLHLTGLRATEVRFYLYRHVGGPKESISRVAHGKSRPMGAASERLEIIVIDSPGPPTFEATLTADLLTAMQDCDGGGATRDEGGDFFVTVSLYDASATGGRKKIASKGPFLYQVNSGSSVRINFETSGEYVHASGSRLVAELNLYENDTDGHHFNITMPVEFEFDPEFDCFLTDPTTCALGGSGRFDTALIFMGNVLDQPCLGTLEWSLKTRRILD